MTSVDGHRLFSVVGEPTYKLADQRLLHECELLMKVVDRASGELKDAVAKQNPEACRQVARRMFSLGALFGGLVWDSVRDGESGAA
jgi:hypothetical protein